MEPLYEDEALVIIGKFLDQIVKDYTNPKLRLSRLTAEREHWLTAKSFLFQEVAILWGNKYYDLEDFLSFHQVDVSCFLQELNNLYDKNMELHMKSNLRRRRKGPRAYLAGPMEYKADEGITWRKRLAEELKRLGIQALIPNEEEAQVVEDKEAYKLLKTEDIPAFKEVTRKIIDADIGLVEHSDLFICKYEGERMSGTPSEATYAYLRGIPTYLITHLPLQEIPGWFLGCFDHEFVDEIELIKHLEAEYNK